MVAGLMPTVFKAKPNPNKDRRPFGRSFTFLCCRLWHVYVRVQTAKNIYTPQIVITVTMLCQNVGIIIVSVRQSCAKSILLNDTPWILPWGIDFTVGLSKVPPGLPLLTG